MPRPSINRHSVEKEMHLQSLDDVRLRLLAKQRGIAEADTLPRKYLLQQLMLLGFSANPLSTPKHDRRL